MSSSCCTSGFSWHGTPQGHESKIFNHDVYVAGDDDQKDVAILFLHDIFGWTFGNNRLLADHFAKEVGGKVFVVDLWVTLLSCFVGRGFCGGGGGFFFCFLDISWGVGILLRSGLFFFFFYFDFIPGSSFDFCSFRSLFLLVQGGFQQCAAIAERHMNNG